MKKLTGLFILVSLIAGLVFAEAEKKEKVESPTPDSVQRTTGARPSRPYTPKSGALNQREMYKERTNRWNEMHQKEIAELAAIKTIAEEEGATRTVAAIQKMIDKKNATHQQRKAQFELQRRKRTEQIQQRSKTQESPVKKAKEDKKIEE